MATVLSAGIKAHLMSYKGVKFIDGKPVMRITTQGKISKACGGRYKNTETMIQFAATKKKYPNEVCKKCEAVFARLMAASKQSA